MRFSEAWLREWVNPDITTEQLADQLSMAGLEVDAVEPAAPEFSGVVVGHVLSREPHPDADKLSVCSVDIGADEPSQIVCGANNVAAGMNVPVATVGARLGADFKIKKAKLRGVQSLGMICSASELGLAESSDGILPLPADAPIGRDFREYLDLDDACIEVDLTPDRGDCLSVAGIAREVSVINQVPLTAPMIEPVPASIDDSFTVDVSAPDACPRYLCRVIRGVDVKPATPGWMVERLRRGGIRSIDPVVDVTNYVLLELGQPMHGFDFARLDGGIRVRLAGSGEKLTLLDGNEIELKPDTLVIADHGRPLALAGIMGGQGSGVSDDTTDVLLESAFFAPLAIAGRARGYGLHTDSSHRFERGVDPALQRTAMERATALLLDIVGGQAGPIVEVASEAHLPQPATIRLRRERVARILGVHIDDATIVDILTRLGMRLTGHADGWDVVPPSARFDCAIEVDLIEEIGRIYGYINIPESSTAAPVTLWGEPETAFGLDRAKDLLVDRDYHEAITYTFISPELADLLTPGQERITLANPISADMSMMRASLWPGLLSTLQHNLARQQNRVRVFESGLDFRRVDGELVQRPKLAVAITGDAAREQWGQATRKADFFDLKGDLEAVLALVDDLAHFRFEAAEHPVLHPGQTARVFRRERAIGWLGMLHPSVQGRLDLPSTFVFEIDLDGLEIGALPAFSALSKYQANRRDLAIVVGREVPAGDVLACARKAAPAIVREIALFDVYTGENIEAELKSLALSLILQESSHTLSEQEVDQATGQVLDALAREMSAKLRA